jgi:hypothetical protein
MPMAVRFPVFGANHSGSLLAQQQQFVVLAQEEGKKRDTNRHLDYQ